MSQVLIGLGYLLATHVHAAWRTRRQRGSGLPILANFALLAATAWGLYYLGDETWRARLTWVHLGAGLALPLVIATHIVLGHRSRR